MPLSDREQQLLEQMELALSAEDPRFANQMRGGAAAARRRDWVLGGVGAVVGLGVVLLGVTAHNMWLGGAGFAVMVAAVLWALTPRRRRGLAAVRADGTTAAPHRRPPGGGRPARSGSFMDRLEERWERRRDRGF